MLTRFWHQLNRRISFGTRKMSRQISIDISPPKCPGMKESLNRDYFTKSIAVLAARVPAVKAGFVLRSAVMRSYVLNFPRIRSVVSNPDGSRLVLLGVADEAELSLDAMQFLREESDRLETYVLNLDYSYWTADDILQAILPEELCEHSPTGFAVTGHLAHMNLNDEYLPYKHIIGQVILDKNKAITTVVNKLDSISDQFRVFQMELIAGEPNYIVEHHESDCRFTFDFTQVYWNSRLHTEHDRLVQLFRPDDVIADVFAGVGPFAIPAAKKGCAVFANDLNPNSARYLLKNVKDNRVSNLVRVFCEDGRDFIRNVSARAVDEPFPPFIKRSKMESKTTRKKNSAIEIPETVSGNALQAERMRISHFVMNLPDSAIQFLDVFRGIFSPIDNGDRNLRRIYDIMPMIHCHCFSRELDLDNAKIDIQQRVEEQLGHELTEEISFQLVRSVAPKKDMYCISFRLPSKVAFAS